MHPQGMKFRHCFRAEKMRGARFLHVKMRVSILPISQKRPHAQRISQCGDLAGCFQGGFQSKSACMGKKSWSKTRRRRGVQSCLMLRLCGRFDSCQTINHQRTFRRTPCNKIETISLHSVRHTKLQFTVPPPCLHSSPITNHWGNVRE